MLEYNARLPKIGKIIKKHLHLINSSASMLELFPEGSIIPAYRRTKNLKEMLAPSKFRGDCQDTSGVPDKVGCIRCNRKCDLCTNFLVESDRFSSFATGRFYKIKQTLFCTSADVVYLISCKKCRLQYVGSASTEFKVRFRNHKSAMKTGKRTCEVASHFNDTPHVLSDFEFIVIEKIRNNVNKEDTLLTREAYWAAQLCTLQPNGLNKRCEYRSKRRIRYNV